MKYQQLLFSRSENVDYRWLLQPSRMSVNDLRILEDLFWSDSFRGYIETKKLFSMPIYCLHLASGSVLLEFRRTSHIDIEKREIDALQGIYVERELVWYFRFALTWLLSEHRSVLNVWDSGTIDFRQADLIRGKLSGEYLIDFGRLVGNLNTFPTSSFNEPSYANQRILEFNEQGYLELLTALYPSPNYERLNLEQFAFGVLSSEKHKYEMLDFVAYIGASTEATRMGSHLNVNETSSSLQGDSRNKSSKKPAPPTFENMVDSMKDTDRKSRTSEKRNPTKENDPFNMILRKLNLKK